MLGEEIEWFSPNFEEGRLLLAIFRPNDYKSDIVYAIPGKNLPHVLSRARPNGNGH